MQTRNAVQTTEFWRKIRRESDETVTCFRCAGGWQSMGISEGDPRLRMTDQVERASERAHTHVCVCRQADTDRDTETSDRDRQKHSDRERERHRHSDRDSQRYRDRNRDRKRHRQ
eukprot:144201-Rhodomonas_salina.1